MKEILLSNGMKATVDDQDFEYLSQFNWFAEKTKTTFYAQRNCYNKELKIKSSKRMHREILGTKDTKIVTDHIDGNGLNNQRANLRACTQGENLRNTRIRSSSKTGFRGVNLWKGARVWKDYSGPVFRARICINHVEIHLGYFKTAEEAAAIRDSKTKELHGNFGVMNL